MADLRTFYPEIEPYETGMLDVGDGHHIYYERIGTPGALPAVFLHGGPGAGIMPSQRRVFDPARYDVILFDQRGCGRSTPHANLDANTTWHLVADIERMRELAGVERWLVFGGSWGSTLSLAYAQTHPDRVTGLIVRGVFTADRTALDWYYRFGASEIYPDKWERFLDPVRTANPDDLIGAYRKLLTGDDKAAALAAAKAWSLWEAQTITLLPQPELVESFGEDDYATAFARIENHFFFHECWLEPDQLLRDAHKLSGIPGTIVQGRYDIACPVRQAWELHQRWRGSDLRIVEGSSHAFNDPGILHELIEATDRFAAGA